MSFSYLPIVNEKILFTVNKIIMLNGLVKNTLMDLNPSENEKCFHFFESTFP